MQKKCSVTCQYCRRRRRLNPLKDAAGVRAVDYTADFDGFYKRIDNLEKIFKTRKGPGKLVSTYQGQINEGLCRGFV